MSWKKVALAMAMLSLVVVFAMMGCTRKETIIDIETPRKKVEVQRDKDTGEVDVNVERRRGVDVEVGKDGVEVEVKRKSPPE